MDTREKDRPTRPASHYFAIFLAFALTATNLGSCLIGVLWAGVIIFPRGYELEVLALVSSITFVALYFINPRGRLGYYTGVVCVVLLQIRSIQSLMSFITIQVNEHRLGVGSLELYPFVSSLIDVFVFPVLLWSFTLGAKSRAYFGLPPITKTPESELSPGEEAPFPPQEPSTKPNFRSPQKTSARDS